MKRAASKGKIIILSSPSGGGKSTICRQLLGANKSWKFSVSYTTRDRRRGEVDSREYHFVDRATFLKMKRDCFFAETALVHNNYYGTPRRPLENIIKMGGIILLDVDVKGAARIRKNYPEALSIFILPPSKSELKRRLRQRGTETKAQLALRLKNAIAEMKMFNHFDYVIINDSIKKAVSAADHIIKSWTVGITYFGRNKSKSYPVSI